MPDNFDNGIQRNAFLFQHLVAMFQTLALQQLGKLVSPISGKLDRDLQQARITIDMLQMIKGKTEGNLDENERMLLDHVLMELQMNYVDEQGREGEDTEGPEPAEDGEKSASEQTGKKDGETETDGDTAEKSEEGPAEETDGSAESDGPASSGKQRSSAGKSKRKSRKKN